MPEELKEILRRELDELKQNKIRVGIIASCLVVVMIIWIIDDSSGGEEIVLTEEPPVTKDLPVKVLPIEKTPDGVKIVLGASANELFIGDPFAVEEKIEPEPLLPQPTPQPLPKIPELEIDIHPPPKHLNNRRKKFF